MRYAIISDLHANESALRHVLSDASRQGADQIVCLGDVVGYGPLPRETLALARANAAVVLAGNHDDAVSGRQGADDFIDLAGDAVARHRDALGNDEASWLKALPYTCEFAGCLAAHGDFTDPTGFNYIDDEPSARANFEATVAQLLFVGHTHVPCIFVTGQSGNVHRLEPQDFALEDGKRYIVNPGSVGYPREQDGTCRSSYVLYDSDLRTVVFRFLPFAVSSVMQRGKAPRRRFPFLPALVTVIALLAAGVAFLVADRQRVQATQAAQVSSPPDVSLVIDCKSLDLRNDLHHVLANLKIDRTGDPVDLHVEFLSPTGAALDKLTITVKGSSAKPFKIPPQAATARFTISRQNESARPKVISFAPSAK